jgi:undecaprenyl-diphosphatase
VGLNEDVFLALNGAGNPVLDPVMIAFSFAGMSLFTFLWFVPVWFGGRRREAIDLVVLLGLVELTTFALKLAFAVPRPGIGVVLAVPLDDVSDPAFPSGHASRAFAVALFLTLRSRRWRWGVPLLGYAVLVALSRVYVGVHWPSDVLGGAILGSAFAIAFWRLGSVESYRRTRDRVVAAIARDGA